jgi:hypothetical protein
MEVHPPGNGKIGSGCHPTSIKQKGILPDPGRPCRRYMIKYSCHLKKFHHIYRQDMFLPCELPTDFSAKELKHRLLCAAEIYFEKVIKSS